MHGFWKVNWRPTLCQADEATNACTGSVSYILCQVHWGNLSLWELLPVPVPCMCLRMIFVNAVQESWKAWTCKCITLELIRTQHLTQAMKGDVLAGYLDCNCLWTQSLPFRVLSYSKFFIDFWCQNMALKLCQGCLTVQSARSEHADINPWLFLQTISVNTAAS